MLLFFPREKRNMITPTTITTSKTPLHTPALKILPIAWQLDSKLESSKKINR